MIGLQKQRKAQIDDCGRLVILTGASNAKTIKRLRSPLLGGGHKGCQLLPGRQLLQSPVSDGIVRGYDLEILIYLNGSIGLALLVQKTSISIHDAQGGF